MKTMYLTRPWMSVVAVIGLVFVMYYFIKTPPVPLESIPEVENADTICLKRLLLASIEAAKRGGDMVKKVKNGDHLDVSGCFFSFHKKKKKLYLGA